MAPGRITTFANTFLVANHEHGGPVLKVVGPQETRKKRPHRVRSSTRGASIGTGSGPPCGEQDGFRKGIWRQNRKANFMGHGVIRNQGWDV